jgi:hypothetical protein
MKHSTLARLRLTIRLAALAAAIACVVVVATVARATGTLQINHKDGSVNTYEGVTINVFSGSLFLTTADGKGTLVVNRSACSYQAKLIVCLPNSVILVQKGKSNALALTTGTVYLNYTDDAQPLTLTSAKLPPHTAMVSFSTSSGTYVNLLGTLDQVIRQ